MLTAEIATAIVNTHFDRAAAEYKKSSGSAAAWLRLIEAMLVLQSWGNETKLADQSGLLAQLCSASLNDWAAIIVEHDTGKTLASLMEANS